MEGSIWRCALLAITFILILAPLWDSYYTSQSPTHYRKDDGLQYNTGFSKLAPTSDFDRRPISYTLKLMFSYSQIGKLGWRMGKGRKDA